MKKYEIIKTIHLDFLTPQDQITLKFSDGIVEWNERGTAWYIEPSGEKHETINTDNAIQWYIDNGFLLELK
jgi:hypothetical protein